MFTLESQTLRLFGVYVVGMSPEHPVGLAVAASGLSAVGLHTWRCSHARAAPGSADQRSAAGNQRTSSAQPLWGRGASRDHLHTLSLANANQRRPGWLERH